MRPNGAVCFITPPSIFLLDERVYPALGILKVAASAERLGYIVEHLDLNGVENFAEAVREHSLRTGADVFAITATTPQMPAVEKIRATLRKSRPDARLILGGPHPTVTTAAERKERKRGLQGGRASRALAQLMESFDMVVAGDGELAIGYVLDSLRIGDAPRLVDSDDPRSRFFLSSSDFQDSPWPARHLIDMSSYHFKIDGKPVSSIVSQLGCPFNCQFCCGRDSGMLRRVRLRAASSVISEMRHMIESFGLQGFMFFDDELNVNPDVLGLLRGIRDLSRELGVELACRGFVKAELLTSEQADAMREAGFRVVLSGFESGNERVLRNIEKRATLVDNTRAIETLHASGIQVKALMSLGHAGESEETIRDTVDWLLATKPEDFDVTLITAYPGSPYYDDATPVDYPTDLDLPVWKYSIHGDALYSYELDYAQVADYYKGCSGAYQAYVFTDHLTTGDLVRMRDWVEEKVRNELRIRFHQSAPSLKFESSMGQLPSYIFRQSGEVAPPPAKAMHARTGGTS
jgi:radical SAM superfamily enzyme YgiQ (UPF0313 family)